MKCVNEHSFFAKNLQKGFKNLTNPENERSAQLLRIVVKYWHHSQKMELFDPVPIAIGIGRVHKKAASDSLAAFI